MKAEGVQSLLATTVIGYDKLLENFRNVQRSLNSQFSHTDSLALYPRNISAFPTGVRRGQHISTIELPRLPW